MTPWGRIQAKNKHGDFIVIQKDARTCVVPSKMETFLAKTNPV
jgi:hypothetical protein